MQLGRPLKSSEKTPSTDATLIPSATPPGQIVSAPATGAGIALAPHEAEKPGISANPTAPPAPAAAGAGTALAPHETEKPGISATPTAPPAPAAAGAGTALAPHEAEKSGISANPTAPPAPVGEEDPIDTKFSRAPPLAAPRTSALVAALEPSLTQSMSGFSPIAKPTAAAAGPAAAPAPSVPQSASIRLRTQAFYSLLKALQLYANSIKAEALKNNIL